MTFFFLQKAESVGVGAAKHFFMKKIEIPVTALNQLTFLADFEMCFEKIKCKRDAINI
jgi:hypothetical protein